MDKPFNGLSNAEAEALALLIEEAAEVIHCATKILRHGKESTNPRIDNGPTNIEHLNIKLGDMEASINICHSEGFIDPCAIRIHCNRKLERIQQYLHLHHTRIPAKTDLPPVEVKILNAVVIVGKGADKICIETSRTEATYPFKEALALNFQAAAGTGEKFVEDNFAGLPIKVVTI